MSELTLSVEETNKLRLSLGLRPLNVIPEGIANAAGAGGGGRETANEAAARRAKESLLERLDKSKRQRMLREKLEGPTLADDGIDERFAEADAQRNKAPLVVKVKKTKTLDKSQVAEGEAGREGNILVLEDVDVLKEDGDEDGDRFVSDGAGVATTTTTSRGADRETTRSKGGGNGTRRDDDNDDTIRIAPSAPLSSQSNVVPPTSVPTKVYHLDSQETKHNDEKEKPLAKKRKNPALSLPTSAPAPTKIIRRRAIPSSNSSISVAFDEDEEEGGNTKMETVVSSSSVDKNGGSSRAADASTDKKKTKARDEGDGEEDVDEFELAMEMERRRNLMERRRKEEESGRSLGAPSTVPSWRASGEELTILPGWGSGDAPASDASRTDSTTTSSSNTISLPPSSSISSTSTTAPNSSAASSLDDIMGPPPLPTSAQQQQLQQQKVSKASGPRLSRGMGSVLNRLVATGEVEEARKDVVVGRSKDARFANDLNKEGDLVKLEYRDESGHLLTPHEAFRQLTYVFHGEGPGAKKKEARIEQIKKATAKE